MNEVDPDVLTTFPGLLLRDLLDNFNGDVASAVAAYNGGPGNPNKRYEEGVRAVANHRTCCGAERGIGHAKTLD